MSAFAAAHARGGTAEALATRCAAQIGRDGGYTLGFVYVTSPLAGQLGPIVARLKEATGVEAWVGTAGHGICTTAVEIFGEPAVAVLACRIDPASFRLISSDASGAIAGGAKAGGALFGLGVVHADPRAPGLTEGIARVAADSGAYLVGGLTSADTAFPQAFGGRIVDDGVSGVLLGSGVEVAVGLTQGCSPIGPVHEVTRAQDQVLITLDRRRAYDILAEDAGLADGDDPRQWLGDVHAALPVAGTDRADYVVRNLIGIDVKQGLVAIADTTEAGDKVLFVRRDAASAVQDLNRMVGELKARVSRPPKAALYFSCVARGPNLFREPSREMKAVQEAFGDIPVAGFFGNGEISNDRIYAYTGVLTLFC